MAGEALSGTALRYRRRAAGAPSLSLLVAGSGAGRGAAAEGEAPAAGRGGGRHAAVAALTSANARRARHSRPSRRLPGLGFQKRAPGPRTARSVAVRSVWELICLFICGSAKRRTSVGCSGRKQLQMKFRWKEVECFVVAEAA